MHDSSVMFTSEDVTSSAHISCKLVNFTHSFDNAPGELLVAEVTFEKFIGCSDTVLVILNIGPTDPEALPLKALDEVTANKSASTAN